MTKGKQRVLAVLIGTGLTAFASAAFVPVRAADSDASGTGSNNGDQAPEEVVVTGTLLRNTAPTGSNLIIMDSEQIQATGAIDTDQLLSNLPQVGNLFNNFKTAGQGIASANDTDQITRPNLRNLPGGNTSTGPQTLVLVDGHRVVPAGIGEFAVDPEIIPPSLIDHVEVITDGASAVYGSDAIGGVINFITRREFNGLQADGGVGFADGYSDHHAGFAAGTEWNDASAYVGYNYAYHDPLFGGRRDWIKQIDWSTGIPTGRFCDVANVTGQGSATMYRATDLTTPGFAACDASNFDSIIPETYRHNAVAGFDDDITSSVNLDVRAIYSYRDDATTVGPLVSGMSGSVPFGSGLLITPANPYYRQIPSLLPGTPELVQFNYGPVLGNASDMNLTSVRSWNVTPTLSWDTGLGWQLRAMFNYGESRTSFDDNATSAALESSDINGTTLATAIDPYDIAATQNLNLVRQIGTSFINRGVSTDQFVNARLIFDGTPITLPGGDMHVGVGAEYMLNNYSERTTNTFTMMLAPWQSYGQDVKSAFGEVAIPIVGEGNAIPGINKLDLSASLRYDSYNDVGDTTNAKVGLGYKPVDWITFRGNWGQSFNAPTPVDRLNALNPGLLAIPYPVAPPSFVPPPPPPPNVSLVAYSGTVPNLKPQTADTWSLGARISPPVIAGIDLDASYYHLAIRNLINSPTQVAGQGNGLFVAFPNLFTFYPNITPQDIANFLALNPLTGPGLARSIANERVIAIADVRTRNIGLATIGGLDMSANYTYPTSFGSLDARFAGNYQIEDHIQASPLLGFNALATDQSVFNATFSVGGTVGDFRAQASLNHTAGYAAAPTSTLFDQTRVGSFDTVDLFFSYQIESYQIGKWEQMKGPLLTLSMNNVFDRAPPVYRSSGQFDYGYRNGFSVGRLIELGLTQTF